MSTAPLLRHAFSVVDVETTGASAIYDRVIEVAVVRIEAGQVANRFSTLVNPKLPVPAFITRLTGIDDRMLRARPTFGEVAADVDEALGDGPFVAHNVNFDYAFMRHAFTRAHRALALPRLCTLRLARRLLPRLRSHRLDAVTAHLGIKVQRRHRAEGDAEATAAVLMKLLDLAAEQGIDSLDDLIELQDRPVTAKRRGVDESVIAGLTPGPGVYLLKDADGHVVYVGKSIHVRQRVREHLRGGSADQPRLRRRLHAIVDVEAFETGSELEALFLESRLIKRYLPDANLLQRNDRDYPFIKIDVTDPFPRIEATREPASEGALHFGPFRRRATVAAVVDFLQERLRLRACTEPLRPGQSACALLDMGKCSGPCVGAIDRDRYRANAQRAADILRGRDGSLLDELEQRRDQLAEEWRFEEAAELRDRVRQLAHVVGTQRRLDAVAERNLAIVAPSTRSEAREVFLIHGGQLARQVTLSRRTRRSTLEQALRTVFNSAQPAVTREKVDEMHLLDAWLLRHRDRVAVIRIDPSQPVAALDEIRSAASA